MCKHRIFSLDQACLFVMPDKWSSLWFIHCVWRDRAHKRSRASGLSSLTPEQACPVHEIPLGDRVEGHLLGTHALARPEKIDRHDLMVVPVPIGA